MKDDQPLPPESPDEHHLAEADSAFIESSADGVEALPVDFNAGEDEEEGFSLDDLGAAYAKAMAESGLLPPMSEQPGQASGADDPPIEHADSEPTSHEDDVEGGVSPLSIVEAALFIGHPENKPLTAAQMAATMRGVSAEEVDEIVLQLNEIYRQNGHAFQIVQRDSGYVLGISHELRSVRSAFYGKVRETRLNQAAIDVLALVAYQPGITSATISEQRGKDSGAIVNQMVRRELLEVRREPREDGKPLTCYYPSARLLNLLGLRSLEDLPHVDEADISPQD